jgi:hypothetical protein
MQIPLRGKTISGNAFGALNGIAAEERTQSLARSRSQLPVGT